MFKAIYSGTCAIRHLSFATSCDYSTTIYDLKVLLLTKLKPEYSDMLFNLTHFPGPLVYQIGQVQLYM